MRSGEPLVYFVTNWVKYHLGCRCCGAAGCMSVGGYPCENKSSVCMCVYSVPRYNMAFLCSQNEQNASCTQIYRQHQIKSEGSHGARKHTRSLASCREKRKHLQSGSCSREQIKISSINKSAQWERETLWEFSAQIRPRCYLFCLKQMPEKPTGRVSELIFWGLESAEALALCAQAVGRPASALQQKIQRGGQSHSIKCIAIIVWI